MRIRFLIALVVLLAGLAVASRGSAQTASDAPSSWRPPIWRLGDAFDVEITVPTLVMPREPVGSLDGEPWTQVVHYSVVGTGIVSDRPAVFLRASPERFDSEYVHVIDAERMALLEMQVVLPSGEAIVSANPFGADAVLWMPMAFGPILADFPRLVADASLGEREIALPHDGYPSFTERTIPGGDGSVVVELERVDPDSGATHKVTQRWLPGKPWWSSAEATLGDRLLYSGRLVATGVAGRAAPLYLPIANPGPSPEDVAPTY